MGSTVNKFADLTLDLRSPVPLYVQIGDAIRQAIAAGLFQPGEFLPTNREVAGLLNVDQKTVHRAMTQLSREKLVERRRGRGTFVLSATRQTGHVAILSDHQLLAPDTPWIRRQTTLLLQQHLEAARQPHLLYVSGDPAAEVSSAFERLLEDLSGHQICGLVLLSWQPRFQEALDQARKMRVPVLTFSYAPHVQSDCSCRLDLQAGIRQAAEFLVQQNHAETGLVFNVNTPALPSRDSLAASLKEAGAHPVPGAILPGPCTRLAGYQIASRLPWSQLRGLIVTDDHMASGIEQWLLEQRVAVPCNLRVVSLLPPLSDIRFSLPFDLLTYDHPRLVATGADLLIQSIRGRRLQDPHPIVHFDPIVKAETMLSAD